MNEKVVAGYGKFSSAQFTKVTVGPNINPTHTDRLISISQKIASR